MRTLRTISPWILMSILALLSVCSGSQVSRAARSGSGPNRGKFNLNNGMQCAWTTKDANDEVKMLVECENPQARIDGGVTDVQCEYRAKPQNCPGYQSDPKGFYKQVSRALKKLQGKLCYDRRALVKAGMCRRSPRDAHFKLDIRTTLVSAQSGGDTDSHHAGAPTTISTTSTTTTTTTRAAPAPSGTPVDCKGRADHRQVAEEYCKSSWASVCAFFFSMLQSSDC